MNISIQEQTSNRARISIELEQQDYQEKLDRSIKQLSKTMDVPGFRKGKVPTQMVKKMVGEALRLDAIDEVVSDGLADFMEEKELKTILYPIPLDQNSEEIKKDNPSLLFDVALTPVDEMNFDFSDHTFTKYQVEVTDEAVDESLENAREQSRQLVEVDAFEENAILEGTLVELEGDLPREGGLKKEDAMIFPEFMKDDEEKAKLESAVKGSIVIFEPYKAFHGEAGELTSLLGIEREEVEDLKDKEFSYQVERIRASHKPELNQEFFDRAFGEGVVSSEEEARAKVREFLENGANNDANFLFHREFVDFINEERAPKVELADEVIMESYRNAKLHDEDGQEDFEQEDALKSLREELYLRELAKQHEVDVTFEEIHDFAFQSVRSQFAQMGWANAPADIVQKQAEQMLENDNYAYSIMLSLLGRKVSDKIQDELKLDVKTVTNEELQELIYPTPEEEETEEPELTEAEEEKEEEKDEE